MSFYLFPTIFLRMDKEFDLPHLSKINLLLIYTLDQGLFRIN